MSECTCYLNPESDWFTYGSAVEPGSQWTPNPDCPEHFPTTPKAEQDVSPCPMCLQDGKHDAFTHQTSTCPAWVGVSAAATSDLKGWLAADGLSVEVRHEI